MIRERCHGLSKLVHTLAKNLFLFSTTKRVVNVIMGMLKKEEKEEGEKQHNYASIILIKVIFTGIEAFC